MKQFLFSILLSLGALVAVAQQTLTFQIGTASDDLEEYLPGPNQTQTVGALDVGSSDLEFGTEAAGNMDPQLVGLRFTNVAIPKGALVLHAYLQFQVDNTTKNTDPANIWIKAQDGDNPLTFNDTVPFNISARPMLMDSVYWPIPVGSWSTTGQNGADQRSADLAALVQAIVDRGGWTSGNALVLTLQGTGLREAESYDGLPAGAAKLIVEFIPAVVVSMQVNDANDDLEEYLPGANQTQTVGYMDAGSSDLELGNEAAGNIDPQLVGVRFRGLNVPPGALIKNAYLQFQVDNTSKNTDPTSIWITAQDESNPLTFDANITYNISSRPTLNDSVYWGIPAGSWATTGEQGADQRSPDLAQLVQTLVNRPDWALGNSMVFLLSGTGLREAESFDGLPAGAPQLVIEYIPSITAVFAVSAENDDLEEYIAGPGQTQPLGTVDVGSSDLELGNASAGSKDPQLVGVRFPNVTLTSNAVVNHAYLQFQVDNTSKNTDPTNIWIKAQDADNPAAFDDMQLFSVSSRPTLQDSVYWSVPLGSWTTIGQSGADQRSADIAPLVQALVNRNGWTSGNAMVFTLYGTGLREAESYEGLPEGAAKLIIETLGGDGGGDTTVSGNLTTTYPIQREASWSYLDDGLLPAANWTAINFNDTTWAFGNSAFGYGLPSLATMVSFGSDNANKYITTYFRKRIVITDLNALPANLELQIRLDDGAIVYVNGVEVKRINLPAGVIGATTLATLDVTGNREQAFFTFDVPKSFFQNGTNVIAVEVHQFAANSPDLVFDLSLVNPVGPTNASNLGCQGPNDLHIGCFTSLLPRDQLQIMEIPAAHAFQFVAQAGDAYTLGSGALPENFDFTGYVPQDGFNSRQGHLSINHELNPGGVSVLDLGFDYANGLWTVDTSGAVSFAPVAGTVRNCSGTVTSWGTVVTSEENLPTSGDLNGDGYIDIGWNIEIDPLTRKIRDYGNGPQKLWAMGRMSHENIVVAPDQKTAYQGEDSPTGGVYKFVADAATNLSSGQLYVLKLDQPMVNGEPTGTTGTWVLVPNTTVQERNETAQFAAANGTTFNGVEDVEINPLTGQIYFSVKGVGRVYRLTDNGSTVANFETFVGGKAYRVTIDNEVVTENWGLGIDNLTFDDRANLWALQDGGRNHVWVVRPDHTQASPKVEVFMHTPFGSEPTGMTFTPDYRYMFISLQGPSTSNTAAQADVSGQTEVFNKSTAVVVSRTAYLGSQQMVAVDDPAVLGQVVKVYPNPFSNEANIALELTEAATVHLELFDQLGRSVEVLTTGRLERGAHVFTCQPNPAGIYFCRILVNGKASLAKLIKQ